MERFKVKLNFKHFTDFRTTIQHLTSFLVPHSNLSKHISKTHLTDIKIISKSYKNTFLSYLTLSAFLRIVDRLESVGQTVHENHLDG